MVYFHRQENKYAITFYAIIDYAKGFYVILEIVSI